MDITIAQNREEVRDEFTELVVQCEGFERTFALDIDFSSILNVSWNVHTLGLDLLVVAASVYGVDKIVPRNRTEDLLTRDLNLSIPVREVERWQGAREILQESISYLTGDRWTFDFTEADHPFSARRKNRRKRARGFPQTPVVSMLSGGLDSFIGALDLLAAHQNSKILFVSHYDGHVSGPASDQEALRRLLSQRFLNRVVHLQVRTGVRVTDTLRAKYHFETSFRSRSFMFLGLAGYAALKVGEETPILIPENGPIALNMPLNPSRRGACSTRTVHPYFLQLIRELFQVLGMRNAVENPYHLKTKQEMILECTSPAVLREGYRLTNSCGKAGRKMHWANRTAKACGVCVPCLFRRAALHGAEFPPETFGNDGISGEPADYPDLHALLGLVRQNPSEQEIKRALIANGRFEMGELSAYANVVRRMIDEVAVWVGAAGTRKACALANVRRAQ